MFSISSTEFWIIVTGARSSCAEDFKKYEDSQDEYLGIHLKYYANETDSETIVFPSFGKRTMYKGMEVEKEYALEELGL